MFNNPFAPSETINKYKQQNFERMIANLERTNRNYTVTKDELGNITSVTEGEETTVTEEIATTTEEVATEVTDNIWHNTEIIEDLKLPMPTHCLKDKKYCAKEYGALITISNRMKHEKHRYLYKNKFNTSELAKDLGIGRTQLERNIKKLENLDYNILNIENTENGIVYKFTHGEINNKTNNIHKWVSIYHPMLKTLACVFNSNTIKIYCLMCYMCTETEFKKMDNKWLADQIGLSTKSKNNLDAITEIVAQIELCGFIETKKENVFKWDEVRKREVPNIEKLYRLRTFKEWKEIQKTVK